MPVVSRTHIAGVHAVREALRAHKDGSGAVERLLVARGASNARIQECVDAARAAGIPVRFEDRAALDRMAPGAAHQGLVAEAGSRRYLDLDEYLAAAKGVMVVVLDGVEDPHNLGAVMRSVHAAGAAAVVIPDRRSAGLTAVAMKAAAGAAEHLPVVRVGNVNRALEQLKKAGYWIYGLDERGTESYDRVAYAEPAALVLGGEGKGLHQQVRSHCDVLVRIPLAGAISSLNVSVAAGVALFEWKRRRAQEPEAQEAGAQDRKTGS
ncbi:MAG: 23S rRNA (guanosine(2251)-2'-O)-methyltransferase RlmB [Bryobacteraceae bacterium]